MFKVRGGTLREIHCNVYCTVFFKKKFQYSLSILITSHTRPGSALILCERSSILDKLQKLYRLQQTEEKLS